MNLQSKDLLRISFLCWFFSLAGVLEAQTAQDRSSVASKPANQPFVLQKDYDELRRSAGKIKAEEIPAIEQKATAGDTQAQLLLATLYARGCGVVPRDDAKALVWFHKAADQGNSLALNNIGRYYDLGPGHDPGEGVKWYRQAADHNDAVAQYNVGSLYEHGIGIQQNYAEAALWYRKAVEGGNSEHALKPLVDLYERGEALPDKGPAENHKAGLDLVESLASQDDARAEWVLANGYAAGLLGLPRDKTQAINWLRKAAEKNALFQADLGYAYSHGQAGLHKDKAEAVRWYQKSAQQGNAIGEADLAYMYEHGEGVAKDAVAAVKWYQAAAEQGDAPAQHALGRMYEDGKGVHKDAITSIMWFLLAKDGDAPDFMREIHINWHSPGFSFYRHPYEQDYQEALKRAEAWKDQHYCK